MNYKVKIWFTTKEYIGKKSITFENVKLMDINYYYGGDFITLYVDYDHTKTIYASKYIEKMEIMPEVEKRKPERSVTNDL